MSVNPLYQRISDELALGRVLECHVLQRLWSGYGELVRLGFANHSVIVKHVKLPASRETLAHPQGWNTALSHRRKAHSYQVEVSWYEHFSQQVDRRCLHPKGLKTLKDASEWLIVMEDLAALGFVSTPATADPRHLQSALSWLANFHAKHLYCQSDHLWEQGSYWHLNTRPDELAALTDYALKKHAHRLDQLLIEAPFPTLIHGDAKLANFCFNADTTACAAVDFQYVGQGCAMKDVAYFMSSAVAPKDCAAWQDWVLSTYFNALENALTHYQPMINPAEVQQAWQPLFPIAWADFQRFVKGWNPQHYKINDYSESLTARALAVLKAHVR